MNVAQSMFPAWSTTRFPSLPSKLLPGMLALADPYNPTVASPTIPRSAPATFAFLCTHILLFFDPDVRSVEVRSTCNNRRAQQPRNTALCPLSSAVPVTISLEVRSSFGLVSPPFAPPEASSAHYEYTPRPCQPYFSRRSSHSRHSVT